jgi:predicted HAD superfamily Cof-like phosphohydrolase
MIDYVYEFHRKFGLPLGTDDELTREAETFRVNFMLEELREFKKALHDGDAVGQFDALLDLVYVAQGTALFLGIDPMQWAAGMRAVHDANMSKVRAKNSGESKRGTQLDVVKPDTW